MDVQRVTINGRDFSLSPDQDLDALKAAVVSAVRSGGDFVTFLRHDCEPVSELATASSAIRFYAVMPFEPVSGTWDLFDAFEHNEL
ncbi:MAG: hypothetical protein JWQ43_3299 [Glaciihabitans sp.]|nr:hypothetical protein [Glaciihabitans sp.]